MELRTSSDNIIWDRLGYLLSFPILLFPGAPIDVFLSYNSSDRDAVLHVQELLRARGLTTFLDHDNLIPGIPWPEALEQGLRHVRAVIVFIGRQLGGWQKREMWFALDRQVREGKLGRAFPVIPILLPGADVTPGFLFLNTWIDLRNSLDSALTAVALDTFDRIICSTVPAQAAKRAEAICPYRGLRAFREEDAAFFAGRNAFSKRLLEFTLGKDLVAVVGPSGSGKSSVVHAGLLPLLRRQRPPEKTWDAVTFMPGKDPFRRLASALIRLLEPDLSETKWLVEAQELGDSLAERRVKFGAIIERVIEKSRGTGRLLVIADQFEELFTQTPESDRGTFVNALLGAMGAAPFALLVIIRADFYSHMIGLSRELSDRLPAAQVNIGALTADELEEMITRPAELLGLQFEPGLVERILTDVGGEPGSLPLTEFALTELWQRRHGALLSHQTYKEIGGVAGALARRADAEFAKLTLEEQTMAQRLFSRLVRVARPEEAGEDTRQRLDFAEADAITERVVQALAHAEVRLLVTSREEETGSQTVEIVHEALIRNWQRLRDWVNADREFLLWRHRLGTALSEWRRAGQSEGALLPRVLSSEAVGWYERRPEDLSKEEVAFIKASQQWQEREEARLREALQEASRQHEEAKLQRQIAIARQLAAQADWVMNDDTRQAELGALLSLESVRRCSMLESDQALRHALVCLPLLKFKENQTIKAVGFDPDGQHLVVAGSENTRVFRVRDSRETILTAQDKGVYKVALTHDGKYLASAGEKIVKVVEVGSNKLIMRLDLEKYVDELALSPDGRYVAVMAYSNEVKIFNVQNGNDSLLVHQGSILAIAFSPNGRYIATGSSDKTARVFETETGKEVSRLVHQDSVLAVAFNPDARYVATASNDKTARVFEKETGKEVSRLMHQDSVLAVAFSPGGRYVATGSEDMTAGVFEAETGNDVLRLNHQGAVCVVVFTPDAHCVISGCDDETFRVVEIKGGKQVLQAVHHGIHVKYEDDEYGGDMKRVRNAPFEFYSDGRYVLTRSDRDTIQVFDLLSTQKLQCVNMLDEMSAAAISQDGSSVAVACADKTAWIFSTQDGRLISRLRLSDDFDVHLLAFAPNGNSVAAAGLNQLRVFDVGNGCQLACLSHRSSVKALSSSVDGRLLATADYGTTARVFESNSGSVRRWFSTSSVCAVALSPDGSYLATGSEDMNTGVFDVGTGREVVRLDHRGAVRKISFSTDGHRLATWSEDRSVRVFEVEGWTVTSRMNHSATVRGLTFSLDACWIATWSDDGIARVFETATGKEVSRLNHRDSIVAAAFSLDGRYLITVSSGVADRRLVIISHQLRTEDLVAEVHARLTRNLTLDEWHQYIGNEPYRKTCPNLPEGQ